MSPAARAAIGVLYVLGFAVAAIDGSALLIYLPYATVGSILVARRPRNTISWVLVALGWTFAIGFLPIRATAHELQTLTASPLVETIAWFNGTGAPLTFALFAVLACVFPTGRLPEGRWRRVAALVLVLTWGSVILAAFWPVLTVLPEGAADAVEIPNPIGLLPPSILGVRLMPNAGVAVLPVILLASSTVIIARYARARDLERLQLRWLVAALASITVAVPTGFAILAVFGTGAAIAWVPAGVAFTLVPIAIGIAVMRYRLYEIDRLISRTIGWAIVTGVLVAVFAGLVVGLQALLAGFTQGQTLAVAASTLAAFALFQPVRRRVQTAVDHRFDRSRYDGERTAAAFAERLRNQIDLASLETDLGTTVAAALRPTSTGVWIRGASR
jgi:hypothetical protein